MLFRSPDESVGTVLCLDTLEHVEYPRRAMEEIRRILKPDGLVVISSVMNFPIHDYPNDYWRFTPEAFNSLLQDFNRRHSDFAGDEQFPHTVIGVAFKGDIPEEILENFKLEIKVWKELCRGEDEGPENQVSGADEDLPSSPSPVQHFEPLSSKRYEPASLINLEDKNDSHSLIVELAGTSNTILEVGTSTGYMTKILKDLGNRVIGIEIDEEAAEIAEKYCDLMITGDVEEIDLDDYLGPSSIDVAVFGDVLEHLKYPAAVLQKVRRYLKHQGSIVVSIPNVCHGDVLISLLKGDFRYTSMGLLDETHLRFFGLKNVLDLLTGSGYSIEEVRTIRHPVGGTELRRSPDEVPGEIRRFIEGLPNSDVYQFVLLARPSDDPKSLPVPAADLKGIFDLSVEVLQREHEEPLRREVAEALAKSQEASERIMTLGQALSERDDRIVELGEELQGAVNRVAYLNQALSERDDRREELTKHNQNLEAEINEMRRSVVWQLTMRYHNTFVERFLPNNTNRRAYYDLGIKGSRIIINDGYNTFWQKFKKFESRKNNTQMLENIVISSEELKLISEACEKLKYKPKISIIMPVMNTNEGYLKSAIESVLSQIYDNWELCIVDDASTNQEIKKVLIYYKKRDHRIKLKLLDKNQGISGASNEALSLATGEYVGFLDHDDELIISALYEVVKCLNENRTADFVYSDEIMISEDGNQLYAYYRPDFSLDYLLSHPYIVHFVVIRSRLIQKINGFRNDFVTSQDYDLFLRIISETRNIYHIPRILYRWRLHKSSAGHKYKDITTDLSKKAIRNFLERENIIGDVHDGISFNFYRVKREILNDAKVTIIIPTKDRLELLKRCIESIKTKTSYKNYEIIIVDNMSQDIKTIEYLNHLQSVYPDFNVIKYEDDFNYSKINNYASEYAAGEHILFLNNDTEVLSSEWVEALLEHSQRDDIACVGAKLIYPDNRIQHVGVVMGLFGCCEHVYKFADSNDIGYMGNFISIRNYTAVTAACMMIKKSIFNEIGGFDENIKVGFGDIDLCLRAREKGYLNVFTPYAKLMHYESATRGKTLEGQTDPHPEDSRYFLERWKSLVLNGDPYYNPNLPLDRFDITSDVELGKHLES